jgi:hypothetical protein
LFCYANDFGLDDSLFHDVSRIFHEHWDFFQRFQERFELQFSAPRPPDLPNRKPSFTELRYLAVSMFLLSQFLISTHSPGFIRLVQDLFSFSAAHLESCQQIFGDAIAVCPFLFSEILRFSQENLTFLAVKRLTNIEFSFVARFVLFLYKHAARHSLVGLSFSNDYIGRQLDRRQELQQFIQNGRRKTLLSYYPIVPLAIKLQIFSEICAQHQDDEEASELSVRVRRDSTDHQLVRAAIERISTLPVHKRFRKLAIRFEGEQGLDAGGLTREFFFLFCSDIFSADWGMFIRLWDGKYWFSCRKLQDRTNYRVLGRVVAMACLNGVILPIRFPLVVYKKILQIPVCFRDLTQIDPDLYQSLSNLLDMKAAGDDVADCDLTFEVTFANFGEAVTHSLVEGGDTQLVTNQNVDQFVLLYYDWILNRSVKESFDAFCQGFSEFMKTKQRNLLELFCHDELDALISGRDIIDWEALKLNTVYSDGYSSKSRPVVWFWEIFDDFSEEDRRRFMRFSTGCDRIPAGEGFHLIIQRSADASKLPVSHTCFNTFVLPPYPTKEEMKEKVFIAISDQSGFGLI